MQPKFIKTYTVMAYSITTKAPGACTCITEVRNEIDSIDREIIRLLAARFGYVREVVKYKSNTASSIEASDRHKEVLQTRRHWAEESGLSPEIIEDIYDRLVKYFIQEEKKLVNL